ncbi:NUDIX hydrolase [Devosia sp. LC5]|uniref:NUDIX hydrolase n=1 Tax=Devosia sp. LC5 TaxID=1502724 RepID=UPI0004E40D3C|nr:NUDIX hydrolase [Devosia sp. LC5]KFC66333.1 NUDIX hydrolase [Devosia sp. LC5]
MLREFFNLWNPRVESPPGLRQSGAVPYVVRDGRVVFLLVTSRRTGRWIFPKGSISDGMSAWDSAAKEAFEEAGVTGVVEAEPLGSYRLSDKGQLVDVDLYPLLVETQLDSWDEMDQRRRHWALLSETKRLLKDRALTKVAYRLHHRLMTELASQ